MFWTYYPYRIISEKGGNFISGLLPEKQYKSLMKKYSTEQDILESQVSEIQEKLEKTKASSAHIGRFIRLIKKYKQPAELTKEMACELIDKIVVHEAIGKKPNRQQPLSNAHTIYQKGEQDNDRLYLYPSFLIQGRLGTPRKGGFNG